MTRLFGDNQVVTTQIGEVTQGIGQEQLPVQESASSAPTRMVNTELGRFETTATQAPTGTGAAGLITVNYGAGGSLPGNEFSVSAGGVVTTLANALGIEYRILVDLRIGRGNNPGVAIPLARFMYAADGVIGNAVQIGATFSVEIDDADTIWRESFDLNFAPAIGSVFFVEFARDESGNNSGELVAPQPTGSLASWNPVASARIIFIRQDLV